MADEPRSPQRPGLGPTSNAAPSAAALPEAPSVALPKGGGAVRGLDAEVSVAAARGAAKLSVDLGASPGRQGFGPALSLAYDSGAGNGPFGLGWSAAESSISRRTDRGVPRYRDGEGSDDFVLTGAETLVPVLELQVDGSWLATPYRATEEGTTYLVRRYRPRVEGAWARIEQWTVAGGGESHWRVRSTEGISSVYGRTAQARVADPTDPARVFEWLLEERRDTLGNVVSYLYKAEDAANVDQSLPQERNRLHAGGFAKSYLKRVRYGNRVAGVAGQWLFEVVFDYGEHDLPAPTPDEVTTWPVRADPFSTYRPGFEVRTYRLCRRVLVFHDFDELGGSTIVRSTQLEYDEDPVASHLVRVTRTGWTRAGSVWSTKSLPPLELGYEPFALDETVRLLDAESLEGVPAGVDGADRRWVDLEGEGVPGILTEHEGAWFYKHNLGDGSFAPPERVGLAPAATPTQRTSAMRRQLVDVTGDGFLDLVELDGISGLYSREQDGAWTPFRPFAATPSVSWEDPSVRLLDLDGDGKPDLLVAEDDTFAFYRSLGAAGFAEAERTPAAHEEERGALPLVQDPQQSLFFADMSGDGLPDLVRIRDGEACYWPCLGYGSFGAKVTMDAAPSFAGGNVQFDGRRVRLADVDGSGPCDLLYIGEDGTITLWRNRSGNGWAPPNALDVLPRAVAQTSVAVLDVLGTGTSAVVWSSPYPGDAARVRFVDLCGARKPHLLRTVKNNLGRETTMTYTTSTVFALADRAAGTPWLTRLPFPVHVVERVETTEAISRTSIVSRYSYHHGFYDGVEREFRGFARVDQLDAEALPKQSGTGQFTESPHVTGDEFTLPPVWTRTWYHTGAFLDREDIAHGLAREYYQGDAQAPHLGESALPTSARTEELREACRALRGRTLRQEVYAQDGSPASVHPYTTTEHSYHVDLLQPTAGNSFAAFHTWELESVTCHYERDPTDPRVAHQLTLAVDAYGNVTSSASVGYPRRNPAFDEQRATLVLYTESDYANEPDRPDFYRLGLPVETRSHELTGLLPAPGSVLFDHDTLRDGAAGAQTIPYENTPTGTTAQRRLIKRARTVYRKDDLSGPLPLGQVESLALVDCSYDLRYTPGLLSITFGAKISAAEMASLLAGPGAFIDLDGDGHRWAPSSRVFYSADPAHSDASYAQAHFYLPQGAVDPWGNTSTVTYDNHDLLVTQQTDAAGNTTLAQGNYRVLGPWLVTDPNLNRSGVRYDPLGMIVATALMGKLQADGSDEGDHLDTSTVEPSPSDDPTTRLEYDLAAYAAWATDLTHDPDHPEPARVHSQTRVRHKDPATPWLESYAYSDGLGRVALTKAQAEPGDAPERDATGRLMRDGQGALVFAHCDTRWVGSGRVVYDNKGNPVKAYEPFFDSSPVYDDETDLVQWGVTSITRYDPAGRPVRVDNPNGTFRTVEFDPWHTVSSDENDTVIASAWYEARSTGTLSTDANEADAARKAAAHAGTPATTDLDSLGRAFRSVADNGVSGQYATVLELDIEGRAGVTTDALGRAVLTADYDLTGTEIHHVSVDAGERWLLADAGGRPLQAWDSRGNVIRSEYDALRRPTSLYVTTGAAAERLAEQVVYGETLAKAQELNLRGAPYQHRDEAGLATTALRDFKGNILSASRQLLTDYRDETDWAQTPTLDGETFTTTTAYDALNRPVNITTPDGSLSVPTYNQRGLLAAMTVNLRGATSATSYVSTVAYDAKGQRELIHYGNGAITSYTYDPQTFRLTRLQTTRPSDSGSLQDLKYTYDPVGNVTRLGDGAQQTIFFSNQVVTPNADYTYDAIYRLTAAGGREHVGQTATEQIDWDDSARVAVPLPSDWQAMRKYTQSYAYDDVGNIEELNHSSAGGGGFTRTYAYDEPNTPPRNNHLTSTTIAGTREPYTYDAHGNIASMPHLSLMRWDWRDHLAATASQIVNVGTPQTTYYRYDASGQRVHKVTDSQNGALVSRRAYLGPYEVYREYGPSGKLTLERQTLHISDGGDRICLVETTTIEAAAAAAALPSSLTRYQLGNLLGSAILELDQAAAIISYEEYHPYGSTSFQSGRSAAEVSLKRYRYTAKERDTESGFYYHGARYYAPWLGRWTSVDPSGFIDGTDVYAYTRCNPATRRDPSGQFSWDPAAFGEKLRDYITAGEQRALVADRNLGTSLINTAISTTAELARGLTGILSVGTGAAQGWEQMTHPGDAWDVAIGASRILSDAGEVAGTALGVAGAAEKGIQAVTEVKLTRGLSLARAERATLKEVNVASKSKALGELQAEQTAGEAGARGRGEVPPQGSTGKSAVQRAERSSSAGGTSARVPHSTGRPLTVTDYQRGGLANQEFLVKGLRETGVSEIYEEAYVRDATGKVMRDPRARRLDIVARDAEGLKSIELSTPRQAGSTAKRLQMSADVAHARQGTRTIMTGPRVVEPIAPNAYGWGYSYFKVPTFMQ